MSNVFEKVGGALTGAGVGTAVGVALAPFTGGASIAVGTMVGSSIGGVSDKLAAAAKVKKNSELARAAVAKQQQAFNATLAKQQGLDMARVSDYIANVPAYVWVLGIVGLGAVLVLKRRRK